MYFLTVTTRDGAYLHHREKCADLDTVLEIVSQNYLSDAELPCRWNGHFAMRGGRLTRLHLSQATTGPYLRDDIERIDIMSARGLLEEATWQGEAAD
jgi:hypothetical protein